MVFRVQFFHGVGFCFWLHFVACRHLAVVEVVLVVRLGIVTWLVRLVRHLDEWVVLDSAIRVWMNPILLVFAPRVARRWHSVLLLSVQTIIDVRDLVQNVLLIRHWLAKASLMIRHCGTTLKKPRLVLQVSTIHANNSKFESKLP